MALSWNRLQRNVLASGSADHTVKLWDLSHQTVLRTLAHHTGKVQAVAWNPLHGAVMLTGSYDHTAAVFDTRRPEEIARWRFTADVECMTWDPHAPHSFLASTEDGHVFCCDTRKPGATLFSLRAHDASVTSITMSALCPGLLVTVSVDKTAKVWDVQNGVPSFVASRDLPQGPLYACALSPDDALTLAVGGQIGGLRTYDISEVAAVKRCFEQRVIAGPRPVTRESRMTDADRLVLAQEAAAAEIEDADLQDDDEEGWSSILQKMSIAPSADTLEADERAARKLAKKKKRALRPKRVLPGAEVTSAAQHTLP